MEIVVEYVLVDNIVINFLILRLTSILIKTNSSFLRLFFASFFGAVFSILTPLITLPLWLEIVYKLLLGLVITRFGIKVFGFRKNALVFFVFLIMTACVGGACIGIVFLLGGKIESGVFRIFDNEIPLGVILLLGILVSVGIEKVIKALQKKKTFGKFVFKGEICSNGKTALFDVFLDSGNTLFDPIFNKPVLIVDYGVFCKIFDIPFEKILLKKVDENIIPLSHYLDYGTTSGKGKILIAKVEKFFLSNEKEKKEFCEIPIGLSFAKFKKSFDCNAIIGAKFLEEFL